MDLHGSFIHSFFLLPERKQVCMQQLSWDWCTCIFGVFRYKHRAHNRQTSYRKEFYLVASTLIPLVPTNCKEHSDNLIHSARFSVLNKIFFEEGNGVCPFFFSFFFILHGIGIAGKSIESPCNERAIIPNLLLLPLPLQDTENYKLHQFFCRTLLASFFRHHYRYMKKKRLASLLETRYYSRIGSYITTSAIGKWRKRSIDKLGSVGGLCLFLLSRYECMQARESY